MNSLLCRGYLDSPWKDPIVLRGGAGERAWESLMTLKICKPLLTPLSKSQWNVVKCQNSEVTDISCSVYEFWQFYICVFNLITQILVNFQIFASSWDFRFFRGGLRVFDFFGNSHREAFVCIGNFLYNVYVATFLNRYYESVITWEQKLLVCSKVEIIATESHHA